MTVKQLHEILGKYIDVGAGDWIVHSCQSDRFKTRKEHRDWLKSNPGLKSYPTFEIGEVIFADVATDYTLALNTEPQLSRRHDCVEYRAFRRFGRGAIEFGGCRSVPKRPISFVTACNLTGSADTPSP